MSKEKKAEETIKEEKNKIVEKETKEEKTDEKQIIKSENIAIDKEKLQKINEEIKANKKKNRDSIHKRIKYIEILRNVIIAIVGIAYIEITLLGLKRIPAHEFETDLKVFIILTLFVGIIMFEKAFKADRFKIALHGIESIAMGGATIVLLDLFRKQSSNMVNFFIGVLIVWVIYFVIKCVAIGLKKNNVVKET